LSTWESNENLEKNISQQVGENVVERWQVVKADEYLGLLHSNLAGVQRPSSHVLRPRGPYEDSDKIHWLLMLRMIITWLRREEHGKRVLNDQGIVLRCILCKCLYIH